MRLSDEMFERRGAPVDHERQREVGDEREARGGDREHPYRNFLDGLGDGLTWQSARTERGHCLMRGSGVPHHRADISHERVPFFVRPKQIPALEAEREAEEVDLQ